MIDGKLEGGFDDLESPLGQAITMAIEALEKQIPKELDYFVSNKDMQIGRFKILKQALCYIVALYVVHIQHTASFCNECGQALAMCAGAK